MSELAYQRIDYARAYDHYLEAAKLQPDNSENLNMAGLIAHDLGRSVMTKAKVWQAKADAARARHAADNPEAK